MSLFGILQLSFIILKAMEKISWPWWQIFWPTYLAVGLVFLYIALLVVARLTR